MRKIFALILFVTVVLACMAVRTANAVTSNEERRECVMESGVHSQQHHAILFKSENTGVSSPARAQTARGVAIQDDTACSEVLSGAKSTKPLHITRQTITQQNIVERK